MFTSTLFQIKKKLWKSSYPTNILDKLAAQYMISRKKPNHDFSRNEILLTKKEIVKIRNSELVFRENMWWTAQRRRSLQYLSKTLSYWDLLEKCKQKSWVHLLQLLRISLVWTRSSFWRDFKETNFKESKKSWSYEKRRHLVDLKSMNKICRCTVSI